MIKYRPEIDGLRAVAVIPVILFHFGFKWINGGYFGVDVFFVISGFLITSLVTKELKDQSFSFLNFWIRRIRRIVPALLVMTLITLIIGFLFAFRPDLKVYAGDALAATLSYANISMLLKFGDYWGSAAESSPFLHAWSLSVEEQFYVFYPVLLFILYKYKLSTIKWLSVLIISSFVFFLIGIYYFPNPTFYLLPTRGWELASGGILAVANKKLLQNIHSSYVKFIPPIGVVLILSSYFIFTGGDGISLSATLPVLGAFLIIGFCSPNDVVGRILSHPIIVFIGKISYSLYLWHWPIMVLSKKILFNKEWLSGYQSYIIFALTIIFSLLSYYLVEKTTRKSKYTLKIALTLAFFTIGLTFIFKSSLINTTYNNSFDQVEFYGLYYDITPNVAVVSEGNMAKRNGIIAPIRDSIYKDSYANKGIILGSEVKSHPKIVVLGDSHGAMWGKVINDISKEIGVKTSFYTSVGTQPFFEVPLQDIHKNEIGYTKDQRRMYAQSFLQNIQLWNPSILIIACRWSIIDHTNLLYLENLIQYAQSLNVRVLLMTQPPVLDIIGDVNSSQYFSYLGYLPDSGNQYISLIDNSNVDEQNLKISNLSNKYSNCTLFDVNSKFAKNGKAFIISGKKILYYDDDHLSYQGTLYLKEDLKDLILKIIL